MAVRARLNNALKRLGTGWCLHMEARRREAAPYPESAFDLDVAWLLDEERRSRFEAGDPAFETDFRLALTWLPPADDTQRMERWLFDGLAKGGADWRQALAVFIREAATTLDLLSDALPEIDPLDDADLLTWLHDCVSPKTFPVTAPDSPMYLDAWLADADLSGGIAPRLGDLQPIDPFEKLPGGLGHLRRSGPRPAKLRDNRLDDHGLGVLETLEHPPVEPQGDDAVLPLERRSCHLQHARLAGAPVAVDADGHRHVGALSDEPHHGARDRFVIEEIDRRLLVAQKEGVGACVHSRPFGRPNNAWPTGLVIG